MDPDKFSAMLNQEGFHEVRTVTLPPEGFVDTHSHGWEVKALVLRGELTLTVGGEARRHLPGQTFTLGLSEPHAERYGPEGVDFLVGRKYPATPAST